jgi:hypothetical protein
MSALLVKDKEITMELTAEIVRELLYYNPNTGKLFWKERPLKYFKNEVDARKWNTKYAGKEAFITIYRQKTGRIARKQGRIFGKKYLAHRIIWLHYYGCLPKNEIDHINHDPTDNRIINLREVTHSENHRNRTLQSNNKLGHNGVFYDKYDNRYKAHITINNVFKRLGSYATLEEAVEARRVANINYNFHINHGK